MTTECGQCSVCLSPLLLAAGEDTIATTPCGHVYHYRCILQSLEYKKACPNCCRPLTESGLHKVAPSYVGGGDGPSENPGADVAELQRELRAAKKRTELLANEAAQHEQRTDALVERLGKAKTRLKELRDKADEATRERAVLWQEILELRREKRCLRDAADAAKLEKRVRDEGLGAGVVSDVTAASAAVKTEFIKNLHGLLLAEKERTKSLESVVESLRGKISRYRKRRQRGGEEEEEEEEEGGVRKARRKQRESVEVAAPHQHRKVADKKGGGTCSSPRSLDGAAPAAAPPPSLVALRKRRFAPGVS